MRLENLEALFALEIARHRSSFLLRATSNQDEARRRRLAGLRHSLPKCVIYFFTSLLRNGLLGLGMFRCIVSTLRRLLYNFLPHRLLRLSTSVPAVSFPAKLLRLSEVEQHPTPGSAPKPPADFQQCDIPNRLPTPLGQTGRAEAQLCRQSCR